MFSLHETNHYLASLGVRAPFNLPPAPTALPLTTPLAHALVETLSLEMQDVVSRVRDVGNKTERTLAEGQQRINEELFQQLHQLIGEDSGE